MLKLLLGTDWVCNRNEILKQISKKVKERREGIAFLVPELISHEAERELCRSAGDTASRYAEVFSFTRLTRSVCEWCETVPEACLDNGGRLTAMAAAARMLSSKLKSYASVETKPEFLGQLLNAVDEFKRCRITPADLLGASVQTQGTLAQKLEELSYILETYNGICAQGLRDPRDQADWLLEQLDDCDYASKHIFYIDGFPDFSRQNLAILEHFIQNSPEVTVSLNCDGEKTQYPQFENSAQTASEIIRIAKRLDVPVQIQIISSRQDALMDAGMSLFQGPAVKNEELQQRIFPVRCDSTYEECLAAAERVMALIEGGARYRDIGIVCTDMNQYCDILKLVFRRCQIPLYLSGTDDILEKTAISTVLSALDAVIDGMGQKDVIRYLKSVLSETDQDICDRLENYSMVWGIRGERWNQEWTMHPEGLGKDWDDDSRKELETLNQARASGIRPLVNLSRSMQGSRYIKDQVDAIQHFIQEIHLAENLEKLAQKADEIGDNRTAQEYQQLWDILVSALEQLSDMLGETTWETENFTRLFRLLLSQYDVGTIPTVLDCISAGEPSAMRCNTVKHLIILGAQEGLFPAYAGYFGVLTDQERSELEKLNIHLTGGAMENVATELFEIYGCFCGTTDTVWISCPSGQTAYSYRRICTMLGLKDGKSVEPQLGPALNDPWEAGAFFARHGDRDHADGMGLSQYYDDVKNKADFQPGTIQPEHVTALYGKKLRLSASQIDTQSECRLSYFLKYGLRAQVKKEVSIDPAEFGTFVHAVLEHTASRIRTMGGFHEVSLDQTMRIAHEYADQYAENRFADLDSDRISYLFQRNRAELDGVIQELWEELSRSLFQPVAFELEFSSKGPMPAISIRGTDMNAEIRGFVDRVDSYNDGFRNLFRVVDYKTGKKSFDYCDVFNGVGLQMLIYLFALEQGGEQIVGEKPVAAGVQYFPARYPYLSEDGKLTQEEAKQQRQKELRRQGLILRDEIIIHGMDQDDELTRLCCKRKADGTLTGDLADSKQLKQLKQYLFAMLQNMVNTIAAGCVDANPYTRGTSHNACSFCPYGAVCAQYREKGRRNYKSMDSDRFWEEIGKENQKNGK